MKVLIGGIGAVFHGLSLFALFCATLLFLLPGVQDSLIHKANDEYAQRMVPILVAHEPQLGTVTYENTAAYCASPFRQPMEISGITDEYTCSLIENNYVSDTDGLRLRLARKLVSIQIDGIMAGYGMELAYLHSMLLPALALFLLFGFLSFTLYYFSSKTLVETALSASFFTALFSFFILLLSALLFIILPPALMNSARDHAALPLHNDLITASEDLVQELVAEFLLPPVILFGLTSLFSGLLAAALYYYFARLQA